MDKERFLSSGLLEQYVLGLTSSEETQEVEQYIIRFPELKNEVDGMRAAIEQYAMQHSIPPPPHLRDNILREIDDPPAGASGKSRENIFQHRYGRLALLTGALLVCFGLLTAYLFKQNNAQNNQYQALQVEYALFREACDSRQQSAEERAKIFAFLTHNRTQPVHLMGTAMAPNAEAIVYWNDQAQEAYVNNVNLPQPPPGKQYQIWADVEGEMINMGLLENGSPELQSVGFISGAESLNITLEPTGGSVHPTVENLFANGAVGS